MNEGKVKWFNETKGYGFIEQISGKDLFVHKSGLIGGITLTQGLQVEYEIIDGKKGPCATQVKPSDSEE